jgi:DNA-binding NarL/FixJ family response regulator
MAIKNPSILILEKDNAFRSRLAHLSASFGKVLEVRGTEEALAALATHPFRLVLLNWDMIRPELSSFDKVLRRLQPDASRMALFHDPALPQVISAMKWGMADILWTAQEDPTLRRVMRENLALGRGEATAPNLITHLSEFILEKAANQKVPLFEARKDFSRSLLQWILTQKKMGRGHLAKMLRISPRTLHRYISA